MIEGAILETDFNGWLLDQSQYPRKRSLALETLSIKVIYDSGASDDLRLHYHQNVLYRSERPNSNACCMLCSVMDE